MGAAGVIVVAIVSLAIGAGVAWMYLWHVRRGALASALDDSAARATRDDADRAAAKAREPRGAVVVPVTVDDLRATAERLRLRRRE